MKYIRDRGMKTTKIFAILMALGVVASGVFGMTQAGKNLVNQTINTLGLFTVSCTLYMQDLRSLHASVTQHRLPSYECTL